MLTYFIGFSVTYFRIILIASIFRGICKSIMLLSIVMIRLFVTALSWL